MNIVVGYNDNPTQPQSRLVCRFYQRGMCRFGNRCRNIHCSVGSSANEGKQKTGTRSRTFVGSKKEQNVISQSPSKSDADHNAETDSGPSAGSSSTVVTSVLSTMSCGICFDTIMEKTNAREQTFGILPNCNHCFCFACIRKWRQSKEFDFDVSKACPECRKPSEYVFPSKVWFEQKEEKDTFITNEKQRMQKIDCRFFNKGNGSCPFGNTCLYLHELPNGLKIDVGPPRPRNRRSSDIDSETLDQIIYWLNVNDEDITTDEDSDNDFELDLDDPLIAMQYYDHGDVRRYIAMNRFMNPESDSESEDLDFPLFL